MAKSNFTYQSVKLKQKQFFDTFVGVPLAYLHILLAKTAGFLFRRNHSIEKKQPDEICFIKLLGYGSVVMASDSIHSIKKKYPFSKITIICSKTIEEGIKSLGLFDKVYVIDDHNIFTIIQSSLRIIFQLWLRKQLWTVDLEVYSKLTSILALWTFAYNRFGFYFNEVSFRRNLNTHFIYFNSIINVVENYEQIAIALGVTDFYSYYLPRFSERPKQQTYSYIGLNNTCSEFSQVRKLSEKQMSAICNWICDNTHYKVALLGAPSDRWENENFIKNWSLPTDCVENLAGVYSIDDYYQFLYENCKIIITIDTAILHIAGKLHIPHLSIWGPTTPWSRIKQSDENIALYQPVKCSPCAHFIDILPCNGNNFCIKEIKDQTIRDAIQKMINEHND